MLVPLALLNGVVRTRSCCAQEDVLCHTQTHTLLRGVLLLGVYVLTRFAPNHTKLGGSVLCRGS